LIPFNILYENYENGTKIQLPKWTDVKLKYYYEVPIKLWGSYINRHISCFNEDTFVKIRYEDKGNKLNWGIKELLPDGTPVDIDSRAYPFEESQKDNNREINIRILGKQDGRYRIRWGAEKYFGGDEFDTIDGTDEGGNNCCK
jgi:hypothetical protein